MLYSNKIDRKEQCRAARDQLQEMANDPRTQQLATLLERQKMEHEKVIQQIAKEREALIADYRLG